MIEDLVRIGDLVSITIPKENRAEGYNPFPDGTTATVLGFSEIAWGRINNCGYQPGYYVNRAWVKIQLGDGREMMEYAGRLSLVDQSEYDQRLVEFRRLQQERPNDWNNREFLRDLPETPFWEGDFVRVKGRRGLTVLTSEMPPDHDPDVLQVVRVDYYRLTALCNDGSPYPAYDISSKLGGGWHTSASEPEMTLVERGLVWKHFHGEPITFASLQEEAAFYDMLGETIEMRNPANGLYSWTKEQVLDAIRVGHVHGFNISGGFFGTGPSICAKRFKNEELGQRVAKVTLEGFGQTTV